MSINKTCKTCHKPFDTKHEYATDCPSCYFANKKAKEEPQKATQSSLLPGGDIASALCRVADAVQMLAKAVEGGRS